MKRSHIELIVVLVIDVILYFKMTDDSYRSLAKEMLLMSVSFVALLLTIVGSVSLIIDIDKLIGGKKPINNFLSKKYLYLKVSVGILFIIFGFSLLGLIVLEDSFPHDVGSWIWVIIFVSFFFRLGSLFVLGAYKNLKDRKQKH